MDELLAELSWLFANVEGASRDVRLIGGQPLSVELATVRVEVAAISDLVLLKLMACRDLIRERIRSTATCSRPAAGRSTTLEAKPPTPIGLDRAV